MNEAILISGAFNMMTPTDPVGLTRLGRGTAHWPGVDEARVEVTLHRDSGDELSVVLREAELVRVSGHDALGRRVRRWDASASVATRATRVTVPLTRGVDSPTWSGRVVCGASGPYSAFEWTVAYDPVTGRTNVTLWTMEEETERRTARQRGRAASVQLPPLR